MLLPSSASSLNAVPQRHPTILLSIISSQSSLIKLLSPESSFSFHLNVNLNAIAGCHRSRQRSPLDLLLARLSFALVSFETRRYVLRCIWLTGGMDVELHRERGIPSVLVGRRVLPHISLWLMLIFCFSLPRHRHSDALACSVHLPRPLRRRQK